MALLARETWRTVAIATAGMDAFPALLRQGVRWVLIVLRSIPELVWASLLRIAGGLGQMLSYRLGLFQMRETCTVLLAMMLLVAAVDAASYAVRRGLAR